MGQAICAIITDRKTDYNKEIVHFDEGNVVIIPFEVDYYAFESFVRKAIGFSEINTYLESLKQDEEEETDSNDRHTIFSIINVIQTYGLKNFIIEYYSEWASIPADLAFMAVIDGLIIKDSIWTSDYSHDDDDNDYERRDYNSIDKCKSTIGLDFSWVANENRYYSYHDAERDYIKNFK